MKLRSLGVLVTLTVVALLGSACSGEAPADEGAQSQQPSADPRADLEAALAKSAAETASRITVKATGLSTVTEVDRTAKVMRVNGSVTIESRSIVTETFIVDGTQYFRTYDASTEKPMWSKVDLGVAASAYFEKSMFGVEQFLTAGSKVSLESPGRYRVDGAGDAKDLFGSDGAAEAGGVMTLVLDGQGRVGTIEVAGADGTVTITAEFGITVDAKVPADDEIEKG